ncbi:hypothetical protein M5K25_021064 [Dendrobium thyrsiflorum]|uniref:Uncharacterized protein n=1 Tax=Dendrobium thyrsiflorum TaxID=117978 RepID=A0ABD0UIH8_DENTH
MEDQIVTDRSPELPGKLSVKGSSSLEGSRPCFSTHWRATSTRLPLLTLPSSLAARSVLFPITRIKIMDTIRTRSNLRIAVLYKVHHTLLKNDQGLSFGYNMMRELRLLDACDRKKEKMVVLKSNESDSDSYIAEEDDDFALMTR